MPPPLFIPSSSALTVEYGGESWTLDVEHVTTRQAREIYRFIGMPILRLFKQLGEIISSDNDEFEDSEELYNILICLWWLTRCQCGVREPIADADPELVPFLTAIMQAMLSSAPDESPARAGEEVPLPPFPQGGPPSPAPPSPTDTSPVMSAEEAAALPELPTAATGLSAATSAPWSTNTSSPSPRSATSPPAMSTT